MTGNENFESRLLTELRRVSAENPAPAAAARRKPYGRLALAGTGLAAVVAAVAIYTSAGGNTTSAYAVEAKPDGMVTVKIKSLKDAAGLEQSLNAAGVPAEVNYTPAMPTIDCASPATGRAKPMKTIPADAAAAEASPKAVTMAGISGPGGTTFSVDPGHIKPGEKLYITTSGGDDLTELGRADAPASVAISIGDSPGDPGC